VLDEAIIPTLSKDRLNAHLDFYRDYESRRGVPKEQWRVKAKSTYKLQQERITAVIEASKWYHNETPIPESSVVVPEIQETMSTSRRDWLYENSDEDE
jgi:hypothetical protein